ncbi:hypothetical protein ACET3Z_006023 [Daucus carota]
MDGYTELLNLVKSLIEMAVATCLRPIARRNKAYRGQIKAQIFESLALALAAIASKAGEALTKVKLEAGGGAGGGGDNEKAGSGGD